MAYPIPSVANRHPALTFPQARVTALQLILASLLPYPRVAVSLSVHCRQLILASPSAYPRYTRPVGKRQVCIRINVVAEGKEHCTQIFWNKHCAPRNSASITSKCGPCQSPILSDHLFSYISSHSLSCNFNIKRHTAEHKCFRNLQRDILGIPRSKFASLRFIIIR